MNSSMRLLLVEDTEITRKVLCKMLAQIGFSNVTEAVNGIVAWAEIEQAAKDGRPFDFILADWKMPGLSGLELLDKLRTHPEVPPVPFLLLTSNKDKKSVIEAVQSGVTSYLVKPFPAERLRRKMQETWMMSEKLKKRA